MKVEILIEKERGCGYRSSGPDGVGIYLMGEGVFETCERLPFPLRMCSCCGETIGHFRGFKWINSGVLFSPDRVPICSCGPGDPHDHLACLVCAPPDRAGLMWVGSTHYTPSQFIAEAREMGISKRISALPKDFEFGNHPIYLAHTHAVVGDAKFGDGMPDKTPGVFMCFWPTHVDLVIDDENNVPPKALELAKKYGEENVRIAKIVKDIEQGVLL